MRVLVCGGRNYSNKSRVYREMNRLAKRENVDAVIEGDCGGADRIAGYWARSHGIDNLKFRPDWKAHGKAAGPIRNQEMLDFGHPDLVLAFPGGRGTADMVKRARDAGIDVAEIFHGDQAQ